VDAGIFYPEVAMSSRATLSGAPAGSVILLPASELPLRLIAELFTASFIGYPVPIQVDAESLARMVCAVSIDLAASRVLVAEGEPAAFLLVGCRGLSQRVAAMGVLAEHRRRGHGRLLLKETIANAGKRGFRRLLLEVIESNEPAVTLYRTLGFEITRRLVGFKRAAEANQPEPDEVESLTEVDPGKVAKLVAWEGDPSLPWQRSAETLFALQPPVSAFRLGTGAFAIVNEIDEMTVRIEAVLVPRAKRNQGWATRMLKALLVRYPGRAWSVAETLPEELADRLLLANGFQRSAIAQLEMVLDL
jgi:ribosomal protein S18 acetylase RimI-like enzyme